MYTIEKHKKEYLEYELKDLNYDSSIKIIPELGGIVSSFNIKGEELIYFNSERLLAGDLTMAGGNPVLFPISGTLTNGSYKIDGQQYNIQGHGFAREMPWEVIETKEGNYGSIALELRYNEHTLEVYPFKFHLIFTYVLDGNSLYINQEYINEGEKDMPFYSGFHPYFMVGDKKQLKFNIDADKYVDCSDEYADYYKSEVKKYTGKIDFDLPVDFVFPLNEKATMSYSMEDLDKEYKMLIEAAEEFKFLVLWTIQGENFVCVEPWMTAPDAFNIKKGLCVVKPGGSINTWVKYEGQLLMGLESCK